MVASGVVDAARARPGPGVAARHAGRGFTLLELLIAIALLGVLAVLCWRGLESVLTTRDRLAREGDALRAMTIAFAQVDDDLRRSWAVRTIPGYAAPVRFVALDDVEVLELARLGGAATDPMRIDRVAWRVRGGALERGVAPDSVAEFAWQPVLPGVASVQWRAWVTGRGWVPATTLGAAGSAEGGSGATASADDTVPLGVELLLVRADGTRFVRDFAIRD